MLRTQLDQSKAEGARVHTNQLDLVAQVAQLEREVKQKELEVAQRLANQAAEAPEFRYSRWLRREETKKIRIFPGTP